MKLDSPLFNSIRVKPDQDRRARSTEPACEWPGCANPGVHRAPKGRQLENAYWRFCLDHAREYNQSYNYFKGMTDDAVARYQKDSLTGHRPTWKMGVNNKATRERPDFDPASDPFDMFSESDRRGRPAFDPAPEGRTIRNAERKAFEAMGLEFSATAAEIKARFKLLVKRHHPDANGGDRSTEDRLREIIQAYNYLKSVGFC